MKDFEEQKNEILEEDLVGDLGNEDEEWDDDDFPWDEDEDWEYIRLPRFHFETHVTYWCENGFKTSDLEEAKAHGYGKGRSKSVSWGHGNAFETFDYNVLPLIEKLSMTLCKSGLFFWIEFFSDGISFMKDEVWYTSRDIVDGKLQPLVGTAENPYNFIDQGVDIYIFERDGYVMVLSAENWEAYSDIFTGFRVKAEEFYQAWDAMEVPEPYK